MFFSINGMDDAYTVQLKVYLGTQIVYQQQLSAPAQLIAMQFLQLCQQVAQQREPYKIEITRSEPMYNQFEDKVINQDYVLTFWNKQETW